MNTRLHHDPTVATLAPVDTASPIEAPTTCRPYNIGDGITILPSYLPVPGMGVLPANAFLLDGDQPILVDTGPHGAGDGFRTALSAVTDPNDIRWIWLTHTDPDHTGNLEWILDAAPNARLITTYLAVGKLGMQMQIPMERLYWVNPGTTVTLGNRTLLAMRPPSFDAPETTAFFEHTSRTLFSADSFGGLLQAPTAHATDISPADLADGIALWSTVDSPWLTHTDRTAFDQTLAALHALQADRVLSSHLPPAEGLTRDLVENLSKVPDATPWVGPDQAALDQLLAQVTN